MDIKTIRKLNVRLLERDIGSLSGLARMAGTSQSYLSQCVGPAAIRSIGDEMARRLEHAMGKPFGWLDELHTDESEILLARRVYDRLLTVPSNKLRAIAELLDVRTDDVEMPVDEATVQQGNQKQTGRVITLEDDGKTKKQRSGK
ncbi:MULTISPECIES: hypothetical protein [Cupriavidus]|uniref:Uncharacterized protein n=1 Tax=Cupriavidus pauculus TaxID=82633 RepID=A0A3G8H3Q5_9BURK|nr:MULTISPECIES: hypothetical protein [Cupriavidus]AZG14949.1 hypothetical protein EHF44_16840 [Cupriavidus pauculus]MDT6962930.1 hypothetical protein [Cupriavidus sp. SZY C1]